MSILRKNIINNNPEDQFIEDNHINLAIQRRIRYENWYDSFHNKFYGYMINNNYCDQQLLQNINNGYDIYEYAEIFSNTLNPNNKNIF